jgi:hypothetical protein
MRTVFDQRLDGPTATIAELCARPDRAVRDAIETLWHAGVTPAEDIYRGKSTSPKYFASPSISIIASPKLLANKVIHASPVT